MLGSIEHMIGFTTPQSATVKNISQLTLLNSTADQTLVKNTPHERSG